MSTVSVLNTDSNISAKTLVTAEGTATITGLHTFDRDPNPPFAVPSGSAAVTNLDADKLDGQEGTYYTNATNLASGTVPTARLGSGSPSATTFLRGDQTWANASQVLDKNNTEVSVNNTAVETTLYSYSVPGGTLSTTNAIRVTLAGYIDLNTTSVNGTIKVTFGGTTIASGVVVSTATSKGGVLVDVIISSQGATNVQRSVVRYSGPGNAAPADGAFNTATSTVTAGMSSGLTIDTTSAATVAITWTWASANANATMKKFSGTTEKLA